MPGMTRWFIGSVWFAESWARFEGAVMGHLHQCTLAGPREHSEALRYGQSSSKKF
jgi:hypothetical protein